MKKILFLVFFFASLNVHSLELISDLSKASVKVAKSPENRVVLLELYTSEGCSSCPPADRFLSDLKEAGISDQQLIAMAFHVTYWDYIGWKDRFAKKQYDQRQRDQAHKQRKATVYTPQFMMSGDDYRSYATFSRDVNKLVTEKAMVHLELSFFVLPQTLLSDADTVSSDRIRLQLKTDIMASDVKDVGFYLALIENNLSSNVADGENEGEILHHDFVVRQLSGPYFQGKPDGSQEIEHTLTLGKDWKKQDLSIIAFAENPHTGEVLQAVRLKY